MIVVEFFSGIGGIRYALERASIEHSVVAAFDVNTVANHVYRHNFGHHQLKQRNITGLTSEALDALNADLWTMSPPCQPHTSRGKQSDTADRRSDALGHLLGVLKGMKYVPRAIFVENVAGFHSSEAHAVLVSTLASIGYDVREFLLSPTVCGVPNSRLRYYLFGHLSAATKRAMTEIRTVETCVPGCSATDICPPIGTYLLDGDTGDSDIPLEMLGDWARLSTLPSFVTASSIDSKCFTKAYTHSRQGCGSILASNSRRTVDSIRESYDSMECDTERLAFLKELGLRYFHPREIATLLGFPPSFDWPATTTRKQMYRVLGNSVSIQVISKLFAHLLPNS